MREKQLKLFRDKYEEGNSRYTRRVVAIPLDTLILISIIISFIIVISFSMGVKHGKGKISGRLTVVHKESNLVNNVKPVVNKGANNKAVTTQNRSKNQVQESIDNNKGSDNKNKNEGKDKVYVIQVASYLKENIAKREKEHLERKGFFVGTLKPKKSKYLALYVGKFATKEEANKVKLLLKKRYNDCFIRRLQ